MITDKEFDEKVRRMCSEMTSLQIPDVWDGIEKKLVLKRRIVMWCRAGMISAAAAVIAAGFILGYGEDVASPARTVTISEALPLISQNIEEIPPVQDVSGAEVTAIPSASRKSMPSGNGTAPQCIEPSPSVSSVSFPAEPAEVTVPSSVSESPAQSGQVESEIAVVDRDDTYTVSDYLAFADEDTRASGRISMTASSDFYTIYGSGNVNFTSRNMSGGTSSGSGVPVVKPLSGSTPNHSLPLSAGLGVQYGFGKPTPGGQSRFGIGLGVNYTLLRSSYQALVSKEYMGKYGQGSEQASVSQNVHYLGIPVTFFVNILTTDKIFFYASVGGAAEKGLQLKYKFTDMNGEVFRVSEPVSGLQWSADIGLGFEYRFVKFMGVYVDPRLTYYLDCSQPYTLREEQPLQMTIGAGFRFHF